MRSAIFSLALGYSSAECPCNKIDEDGYGAVRMGNEHLHQSGLVRWNAHIDTPIGNEQQEDYAFLLQFSEPVSDFMQHFAVDNAEDGAENVIITPGQNRISGDPYTFNIEGLAVNGDVTLDAWYCQTTNDIQDAAQSCFGASDTAETVPEPNTESENETIDVPDWDCDTYSRCVVKYDEPASIGAAREACEFHNGALPMPKNEEENQELAAIGSTWLELLINEKVDMKYENFQKRQRAYLNTEIDAEWEVRHGTETGNFFCVEKEEEGCENIFHVNNGGEGLFTQGAATWRKDEGDGFRNFDVENAADFGEEGRYPLGTMFQYRCPNKLTNYKPWRRTSKQIQIKCLRMTNGDYAFGECNNRKCNIFNRFPWFNQRLINNINDLSC